MEEAGFEEIGVYNINRQYTVTQYIVTRPIINLYEKLVRRMGAWVSWRWWEQEGLDLAGTREWVAAVEDGGEERGGEEADKEETMSRNGRQGIYCSTHNTIEGQSLVSLWPLLRDWKSTTQPQKCCGATEAGPKERNKTEIFSSVIILIFVCCLRTPTPGFLVR